jgi:hypothetical protein
MIIWSIMDLDLGELFFLALAVLQIWAAKCLVYRHDGCVWIYGT